MPPHLPPMPLIVRRLLTGAALTGAVLLAAAACDDAPTAASGAPFVGRPDIAGTITAVTPATQTSALALIVETHPGAAACDAVSPNEARTVLVDADPPSPPPGGEVRATELRWESGESAAETDLFVGRRVEVWALAVDGLAICPPRLYASGVRIVAAP